MFRRKLQELPDHQLEAKPVSKDFQLSNAERTHFSEINALAADARGREVLVGLTFAETVWYINSSHRILGRHRTDRQKYLELHEKHERARLSHAAVKSVQ